VAALHDLGVVELAAAIRGREISPVEVIDHYLRRIERLNDTVGAFVTITADRALSDARRAEDELRRGGNEVPPLLGVPLPIKDLTRVAGIRCTYGSAAFADSVATVDDGVALRLRAAGTVMIGKTNTSEFGSPCYTEPDVAPAARTPYDLDRSAGGSSGGAAAAVSAGLSPAAHGSDGGGSIRIPASVCGLVGFKPSRGRVSPGPHIGDVSGLPVSGPLTRTVVDAAALLDVLAGPWPGDPWWAPPLPAGSTFRSACTASPGRLRIARTRTPFLTETTPHPDVIAGYESVTALLADLGHEVADVDAPMSPEDVPAFETVWHVLADLMPVPHDREHLLRPLTRWQRELGRRTSATTYAQAVGVLQQTGRRVVTRLWDYDATLMPTVAQPPLRVGELRDDEDPAGDFEAQKRFTPWTSLANVSGQPAVSLPLHQTSTGLPIGVMLVGRPAADAQLLQLAAQIEQARPWRDRRPAPALPADLET
jgi:amidase